MYIGAYLRGDRYKDAHQWLRLSCINAENADQIKLERLVIAADVTYSIILFRGIQVPKSTVDSFVFTFHYVTRRCVTTRVTYVTHRATGVQ